MNQLPVSVGPPMPPSKAPCVLALAVLPVTVVYAASPIDLVYGAIAGIVGYVDDMILGVVGLGVDLALCVGALPAKHNYNRRMTVYRNRLHALSLLSGGLTKLCALCTGTGIRNGMSCGQCGSTGYINIG